MSNRDIIEDWVNWNESASSNKYGRSGNVSYDGGTIYSFNEPIARYVDGERGKYVLRKPHVNGPSGRSSQTSSRHIAIIGIKVGVPLFTVPRLQMNGSDDHLDNIRYLYGNIESRAKYLGQSWQTGEFREGWEYWEPFLRDYEHCELYRSLTGVKFQLLPFDIFVAAINADRSDAEAAWNHPNAVRKRERAQARKLAVAVLGL